MRADQEIEQMQKLFKPQINERSDKLAQLKNYQQIQTGVSERLYNDAQERINKLTSCANGDDRNYTFTPCLSQAMMST
jgi:hypothetical protein